MRFSIVIIAVMTICVSKPGFSQTINLDLIPKPNSIEYDGGKMALNKSLIVYYSPDFKATTSLLLDIPGIMISEYEELTPKKSKRKLAPGIKILKSDESQKLEEGSYLLEVNEGGIQIVADSPAQVTSALQTLLQLRLLQGENEFIPYVKIQDRARFGYRGLHLDVSRHFMPLSFVKKYIDLMSIYKFNTFHWHLTDGAGWRLEINKYPELTEKAAWRTHVRYKDWMENGKQYVEQGSPNASGGFYTQQDVRELVAYAERKGITVIPEIEMPGHSEEVLAVYPELSCTGEPYTQAEFCLGNPKTYEFLKNVLDEVVELFPSEYIHIGGDEANKSHWKNCPKCQALMKEHELKDEDELQSYAVQEIEKYLQSKGRKLIGWDEITEGGLSKTATVMSWRGEQEGINAANAGHPVVMTPQNYLYFDYYQSDPRTQPEAFGGMTSLEKVYSFEPISPEIKSGNEKNILGAQANIWTEYMPTTEQVEYMAFPRSIALAEINWSESGNRDFEDFKERLQSHYAILQKLGVNYYRPSYDVQVSV